MRANDWALVLGAILLPCGATPGCADSSSGATEVTDGGDGQDAGDALSCADYCRTIMAGCAGANQQYANGDNCLNACAAFPQGTVGATGGDTLGCRIYHAGVAAGSAAAAVIHCVHAGPGGAGVCGGDCEGFCDMMLTYCTGAAQVYADRSVCLATCATVPDDVAYSVAVQDGHNVACMLYHAEELAPSESDHCQHPAMECM